EGHRPPPRRPRRRARPRRLPARRGRGRVLRGHGIRRPLAGSRAQLTVEPTLYTEWVKRLALLGATGSIGRQALEIVAGHPELELCAAASGTQPIDGLAPLTQVGGDLTEMLERAQPDLVLNAVAGFAGLPATLWC